MLKTSPLIFIRDLKNLMNMNILEKLEVLVVVLVWAMELASVSEEGRPVGAWEVDPIASRR